VNSVRNAEGGVAQVDKPTAPGSVDYDVAVIGAGPYGLSAGAHLKANGLRVRVFGEPMEFWADKMPAGMLLRSPREASSISDPADAFTLEAYETASGMQPAAPLPLETFVDYGRWFRRQLGSDLDTTAVTQVDRDGAGFRLALRVGKSIRASKVVVAAGIGSFQRKPAVFATLPREQVSHCYEGRKLKEFSCRRVAVIGAGQSALESAALLHESGAEVEVIVKNPELRWIGMHTWLHHLGPISTMLYSKHDVGPAGISRLVAAPKLVARIPLKLRDKIRKRAVRPAGSRWLPSRLAAVKITSSCTVRSASAQRDEIVLKLDDASERRVDHVLLGTGYDVDISRYGFLSPELVSSVRQFDGYPVLSGGLCSSVPGLHFVGATAARSFGPLLYFVAGTEFASQELVSHLVRNNEIHR
jgi:FAD-dependent urate hydroxylase